MSSTGILTVNLNSIADNWRLLSERLSADSQCGAVVKADAYGLGVKPVAKSLSVAGCRTFFVATLAEARELRDCLSVDHEIVVFGGLSHDSTYQACAKDWQKYHLTPVLFSVACVQRWVDFCLSEGNKLPCAIKIDTGMHRLGLSDLELSEVLSSKLLQHVDLKYCMSHFACADTPSHPLNQTQMSLFAKASGELIKNFPSVKLSLANSSGIFLSQSVHYSLVRPGAALYGVNPEPAKMNPMKAVVSLKLPVMQLKIIQAGETVGYGAEFVAQKKTALAIVFGGYADGLFRYLGNNAFGFCSGTRVPLVGRVSMDSMVFDISELDTSLQADLAYIDILSDQQSVDDLASSANTIGYEVLTSLGSRFERRYISDEG